jgi:hypothetical protein
LRSIVAPGDPGTQPDVTDSPVTLDDPRLPKTFWAKVSVQAAPAHNANLGRCWLWTGSRTRKADYGYYGVGRKIHLAHVVAYETLVGPVPDGLQLDHLCRRTNCVRPGHLEPVTSQENNRRSREARGIDGCCNLGHPLDGDNLTIIAGERRCVTCQRTLNKTKLVRKTSRPDLEWLYLSEVAAETGWPEALIRHYGTAGILPMEQVPCSGGKKRRWLYLAPPVRELAGRTQAGAA